ncbi:hypothetical protein BGZ63DRAFT_36877 [Mariannaea sp. PMI_226]|nr:hypothetical protein BGZ63DRAFT_36877 [Mariannaea sp. PMI_226]
MSAPNLTPELLRDNRIFLHEDPQEVEQPPQHVTYLRAVLLDFDCTISDQFNLKKDDDITNLDWEHAFRMRRAKKPECDAVRASLTKYRRTKHQARMVEDGGDRDSDWRQYYFEYFLEPLAKEVAVSEGDGRRTSRVKTYYDAFEWTTDKPWTLFEKDPEIRQSKKELPTPSPECVAYLPIYDLEEKGKVQKVDRWQWPSNPKQGMAMNFSRKVLEHLTRCGLQPSTAGVFGKSWQTELAKSDYQCFPWLIIEHREDVLRDRETRCYCRAANAADAALTLYQNLGEHALNKANDIHVPPVVAMTTAGKDIRVWIAYACNNGEDHRMVCVWKGDVTSAIGIIELEAILENLHTWVMRELRPMISGYIGQWLFRFPVLPQATTSSDPDEKALVRIESQESHTSEVSEKMEVSKSELRDLIQDEHDYLIWKLEKLVKKLAKPDGKKAETKTVEHPKSKPKPKPKSSSRRKRRSSTSSTDSY